MTTEILNPDTSKEAEPSVFTEQMTTLGRVASFLEENRLSGYRDSYRDIVEMIADPTDSAVFYILDNKDMPPTQTAKIMSSLWAVYLSRARSHIDLDGSKDSEEILAASYMMPLLLNVPSERINAIRELPEGERVDVEQIVTAGSSIFYNNAKKSNSLSDKLHFWRLVAKLQGYPSLGHKKKAIEAGEEADDGLQYAEVALDYMDSLDPTLVAKTSMHILSDAGVASPEETLQAVYQRLRLPPESTEDYDQLNPFETKKWLMEAWDKINHIGAENIQLLRDRCGIVNFTDMPEQLLERMVQFVKGDEVLDEQLKNSQVCVVIKDATSDYNGAFRDIYMRDMKLSKAQLWYLKSLFQQRHFH